ncbi:MAG: type III-B CRISPR module RAMP protein Cmr4 [candidate division WOR-3 bacterium]
MTKYSILFIKTIERFYTGAGEAIGIIDNQLIRERITEFPFIQGSSIKGVLRDNLSDKIHKDILEALFGPEPSQGEEHAGAVSFGDAQILAMPIRSLKGCFVWATSPLILHRFAERVKIAGLSISSLNLLVTTLYSQNNKVLICNGSNEILLFGGEILLEEYALKTQVSSELKTFATEISNIIFSVDENFLKTQFQNKLIILPDDHFKYFAQHATEVIPNIRIGEKGTTKTGSLRHTEHLPQETILYSLITFEKSRKPNSNLPEDDVKNNFDGFITAQPTIKFGGDKTTGKGLVKLKIWG